MVSLFNQQQMILKVDNIECVNKSKKCVADSKQPQKNAQR